MRVLALLHVTVVGNGGDYGVIVGVDGDAVVVVVVDGYAVVVVGGGDVLWFLLLMFYGDAAVL